jgi:hypothetical protein
MDPQTLIDPATPGLPAPVWFIELFKVLGFSMHMAPMNLWYAGTILAVLLHALPSEHGRRFSARLMAQMPVIVAMGVNLGIVPLLFVQLGYAKIFYPATVLMAWFWLAIIGVLIPAYYGVYVYAFGLRDDGPKTGTVPIFASAKMGPSHLTHKMPLWKRLAGWAAAAGFLWIGFTFANAMSLMENVRAWPEAWERHSFNGATLGTALNLADPRLLPRWLLMFGLALCTTAAWAMFDAGWFARRESPQYRVWAKRFSLKLYTAGILWFAAAGSWYVFATWSPELRTAMFRWPWCVLTIVTALSPGLPWLVIWRSQGTVPFTGRGFASLVALAQFGVLGLNAVSRQVVQNLELSRYYNIFNPRQAPEQVQWSPLIVFLAAFVLGLALVAWMIAQVAKLPPEGAAG